jgi:phospholipid transport system substrate-binding protein
VSGPAVSAHASRAALVRVRALLLCALLCLAGAIRAEAVSEAPDEIVRSVAGDILGIIQSYQDRFENDPDGYYRAVDETMAGFVDYRSIARAVMARYWSEASVEQQERFVEVFRRGLVRTYARALLEFEQERVDVLPLLSEHLRGDRALVRMEITGGNGRIYPLQYSMGRGEDGAWRVRNVIVDGVNLGLTYRNQFASAMQTGDARGDIDAVIRGWTIGEL